MSDVTPKVRTKTVIITALAGILAGVGLLGTANVQAAEASGAYSIGGTEFNNLPQDRMFTLDQIDVHTINIGYHETCRREIWTLERKYGSVSEYRSQHPESVPDTDTFLGTPDSWDACERNKHTDSRYDQGKGRDGLGASYYLNRTGLWSQDENAARKM